MSQPNALSLGVGAPHETARCIALAEHQTLPPRSGVYTHADTALLAAPEGRLDDERGRRVLGARLEPQAQPVHGR